MFFIFFFRCVPQLECNTNNIQLVFQISRCQDQSLVCCNEDEINVSSNVASIGESTLEPSTIITKLPATNAQKCSNKLGHR